jgi:hypothetical protein
MYRTLIRRALSNRQHLRRFGVAVVVLAAGALVSAQTGVTLPSHPSKAFGASVSPAYEGWFNNPDGTHSFLIGYYSRNTQAEVDIPIGPNNHFEPGNPDLGQPTHFLTRRRFGMFVVTMPKEFPKTQKFSWTLTVNGVTTSVPFYMHTDYNITPLKSSEESPNRDFNLPPVLRFVENGPKVVGPMATPANALERTATVGTPMPLDIWADDDALYSSGGNGPMGGERPPVSVTVSKYRGPGNVTVTPAKFTALKGGKPMEPYSGKASAAATFSEPGDYMLHVTANDYSGNGGGGSGCCWTTVLFKVAVKDAGAKTSGQ